MTAKEKQDTRTSIRRLTKLADLLETIPRKEYDHSRYFNECGAPACALGYATTIPSFRKAGFRREPKIRGRTYYYATLEGSRNPLIASAFFRISVREASVLFWGTHPRTPKQEAKLIRNVIKKYQKKLDQA